MRSFLVVILLVEFGVSALNHAVVLAQTRPSIKPAEASNPLPALIAGEEFLSPELRAKQNDQFENPGFTAVDVGEKNFSEVVGPSRQSCKSCHEAKSAAFRRVATGYPKYDASRQSVITLSQRINLCREKYQKMAPWAEFSPQLAIMVMYLRSLARGSPSTVNVTGFNEGTFEKGKALFSTKIGLLQLSCSQCHSDNVGQRFGGGVLSQGHPQAYPVFSLKEDRVVTLHERFRQCYRFARAEPFTENAPDYIALELYLAWRSKNLPLTTPGVRP